MFLIRQKPRLSATPPPFVSPDDKPDFVRFIKGDTLTEALNEVAERIETNPHDREIFLWENPRAIFNEAGRNISKAINTKLSDGYRIFKLTTNTMEPENYIHYDFDRITKNNATDRFNGASLTLCETLQGMGTFVYRPLNPENLEMNATARALNLDTQVPPLLLEQFGPAVTTKPGQFSFILPLNLRHLAHPHGPPPNIYNTPALRRLYNVAPV